MLRDAGRDIWKECRSATQVQAAQNPNVSRLSSGRTRYYMQRRSCAGSRGFSIFSGWNVAASKHPAPHPFLFGQHFLLHHHRAARQPLLPPGWLLAGAPHPDGLDSTLEPRAKPNIAHILEQCAFRGKKS